MLLWPHVLVHNLCCFDTRYSAVCFFFQIKVTYKRSTGAILQLLRIYLRAKKTCLEKMQRNLKKKKKSKKKNKVNIQMNWSQANVECILWSATQCFSLYSNDDDRKMPCRWLWMWVNTYRIFFIYLFRATKVYDSRCPLPLRYFIVMSLH